MGYHWVRERKRVVVTSDDGLYAAFVVGRTEFFDDVVERSIPLIAARFWKQHHPVPEVSDDTDVLAWELRLAEESPAIAEALRVAWGARDRTIRISSIGGARP